MAAAYTARTKGKVAQYMLAGTTASTTIGPKDSGTILGTVPPGKAGIKLLDGTVQNAADLTVGHNSEPLNFLQSSTGTGLTPTVNAAQLASAGLSLSPQTE